MDNNGTGNVPCPPLQYVRPFIQEQYQRNKCGVDQLSQALSQFAGNSPKRPHLGGVIVSEIAKILLYAAMRAARTAVMARSYMDKPLAEARDKANADKGSFAVQAYYALQPLALNTSVWSALHAVFGATNPPVSGTGAQLPQESLRAALPDLVPSTVVTLHGLPLA
jgi:hypothetical protein